MVPCPGWSRPTRGRALPVRVPEMPGHSGCAIWRPRHYAGQNRSILPIPEAWRRRRRIRERSPIWWRSEPWKYPCQGDASQGGAADPGDRGGLNGVIAARLPIQEERYVVKGFQEGRPAGIDQDEGSFGIAQGAEIQPTGCVRHVAVGIGDNSVAVRPEILEQDRNI